jgi:ribosome-binding factor A
MASRRQRRVADLIHEEISNLLQFQTRDPRIGFVTVTEVAVSPDLKEATIYVSLFSDSRAAEKEVLAGLESAKSFFRHELGQKVNLRYTPDLTFKLDKSLAYAERIEGLLSTIEIPPEPENKPETDSDLSQSD